MKPVVYTMSESGYRKIIKRGFMGVLCGVALGVLLLFIGLQHWPDKSYIFVNLVQFLLIPTMVFLTNSFSPENDCIPNRKEFIKKKTVKTAIVCGIIWLVMAIFGLHKPQLAVLVFAGLIFVMFNICARGFQYLRAMWHDMTATEESELKDLDATYVLKSVPNSNDTDAIRGIVVIRNYAAVYLTSSDFDGYRTMVSKNEYVNVKKGIFDTKQYKWDTEDLIAKAELGQRYIKDLLLQADGKGGQPAYGAMYSCGTFVPYFRTDGIADDGVITSSDQLNSLLRELDEQYLQRYPNAVSNPGHIAQTIAAACDLEC